MEPQAAPPAADARAMADGPVCAPRPPPRSALPAGGLAASRSAWSVSTLSIASFVARQLFRGPAELGASITRQLEFQLGNLSLGHHRIARQIGNDLLQRSRFSVAIVTRALDQIDRPQAPLNCGLSRSVGVSDQRPAAAAMSAAQPSRARFILDAAVGWVAPISSGRLSRRQHPAPGQARAMIAITLSENFDFLPSSAARLPTGWSRRCWVGNCRRPLR